MKPTLVSFAAALLLSVVVGFCFVSQPARAAEVECAVLPDKFCASADASIKKGERATSKNSGIFMLLEWVVGILTAGIGIVAVASFVYAGIMYSSASGNAEQVKKSKDMMLQTIIGLVIFGGMGLVLVWLIPGGIF